MKAEKLPSGRYRIRVSAGKDENDNYHYKSFTADTKKEAMKLAAEFIASNKEEKRGNITFSCAMENHNETKKAVLTPNTIIAYENYKNNINKSYIAKMRLSEMNKTTCQKWASQLSATHTKKTAQQYCIYVNTVLSFYGCDKIKFTLKNSNTKNYKIPTDSQVKLLLENADDRMRLAILIAAFTPARKGEVLALTNEDIDREHNTIRINKTVTRLPGGGYTVKPPKTEESNRTVKMPKEIIDMIPDKPGNIFNYNYTTFTETFHSLVKKLGLNFCFHSLRHYGATFLQGKVPDKNIMKRGGWKSVTTLHNIYQHCIPELDEDAYLAVVEKFNSVS